MGRGECLLLIEERTTQSMAIITIMMSTTTTRGDIITHAAYEDLLFQRVLDKIRIARATGSTDVDLSPDELEAYQSKLHDTQLPVARTQPQPQSSNTSVVDDSASIVTASRSGNAATSGIRTKKSQQRTSLFGSKPKKEKSSNRKRSSITSSAASQVPPGFVVPGPDGQPVYAPINAYDGNLARDPGPSRLASRSASNPSYQTPVPPRMTPPREVLGAFPGSEFSYRPTTPPIHGQPNFPWSPTQGYEVPPVMSTTQPPHFHPVPCGALPISRL